MVQGTDITAGLRASCPALTLQQIYKLTEHHHDDWITGGQTADTYHLLETLKRVVDGSVRPHTPMVNGNTGAQASGKFRTLQHI